MNVKMKIGLLTITNGENYGNRLQNYAVQQVLKSLGVEVETIKNITPQTKNSDSKIKWKLKKNISRAYSLIKFLNIEKFNKILRSVTFNEFTETYIKQSSLIISKDNIPSNLCNLYDAFVCGSDQVWNPNFNFNSEVDFITFARKEQRIAFSPSFGISKLPLEVHNQYREWINGMNYLSTREEAGAKIIKELTGRDCEVLVDPTLMLNKEEWMEIAKKPKWINSPKYILTYFLGSRVEADKRIKEIAKKNNFEIINLMDITDRNIYSVDPSEFVWLINNCELMCTDSFHGAVFSLIMKKPFIVFERKDEHKSMNSRLDTLLSLFDMHQRLDKNIIDSKQVYNIDFSEVDGIIEREKEKAINYLQNALN